MTNVGSNNFLRQQKSANDTKAAETTDVSENIISQQKENNQ